MRKKSDIEQLTNLRTAQAELIHLHYLREKLQTRLLDVDEHVEVARRKVDELTKKQRKKS